MVERRSGFLCNGSRQRRELCFFPSHCVCPTGSVGSYVIEKFPYGIVCAIPNFYMLIFSLEEQSSFLIYHTYLHDIYRERDRVFKNL